ncbi:hypothetical protein [Sphingomonas sp. 3-13AW]|uniref:hypothetical protein n=1 Tax=Sphingomonas sp. 3-13AW TaxID=3050450 RepID=UPI003BB651B5
MNDVDDTDYFYDRAEAELKLAQTAEHPAVVKAHYVLAGYYLDKVYGPGDQHTPAVPLTGASEPLATGESAQMGNPAAG